jgi:hypothetical protein
MAQFTEEVRRAASHDSVLTHLRAIVFHRLSRNRQVHPVFRSSVLLLPETVPGTCYLKLNIRNSCSAGRVDLQDLELSLQFVELRRLGSVHRDVDGFHDLNLMSSSGSGVLVSSIIPFDSLSCRFQLSNQLHDA